jgi:hypothetical protein
MGGQRGLTGDVLHHLPTAGKPPKTRAEAAFGVLVGLSDLILRSAPQDEAEYVAADLA